MPLFHAGRKLKFVLRNGEIEGLGLGCQVEDVYHAEKGGGYEMNSCMQDADDSTSPFLECGWSGLNSLKVPRRETRQVFPGESHQLKREDLKIRTSGVPQLNSQSPT